MKRSLGIWVVGGELKGWDVRKGGKGAMRGVREARHGKQKCGEGGKGRGPPKEGEVC